MSLKARLERAFKNLPVDETELYEFKNEATGEAEQVEIRAKDIRDMFENIVKGIETKTAKLFYDYQKRGYIDHHGLIHLLEAEDSRNHKGLWDDE